MAGKYEVKRPVSMWVDGKPFAYHKEWWVHLDGAPIGRPFTTKAEAAFELNHYYLDQPVNHG